MEDNFKTVPLLDNHNSAEFDKFNKDYKIFVSDIDDLMGKIDKMKYNEISSIQQIKSQFERIGEKMKKLRDNKQYLKDILIDKDPEKFNKLLAISNKIEKKYKEASDQFTKVLQNNKDMIQLQIDTETKNEEYNQQKELPTLNKKIMVSQDNLRLRNLLDVQKEYEQIFKITSELNELSKGIKLQAYAQEEQVSRIDDHVIDIVENTKKTNEEVKKAKEKIEKPNYFCYSVIGIVLFAIVCFLVYILFSKYFLK